MAFTLEERQLLGIHGLLPPALLNQDQQVNHVMQNFYRWDNDLDRFIFMMGLQDRSEKLFFRVVIENIDLMMPIIYTPTVGLACQKYGMIFRKPRYVKFSSLWFGKRSFNCIHVSIISAADMNQVLVDLCPFCT